jgi:hypothetical protein
VVAGEEVVVVRYVKVRFVDDGEGVWGGVVVGVELALGLGMVEDALFGFLEVSLRCYDGRMDEILP